MPYAAENLELKRASNRRYKACRRAELGMPPVRPKRTREEAYTARLAKNAEWRKANPERMKQYENAYVNRHPGRRLWSVAKQRAKKKGLAFTITWDDVVVPEFCPVLGIRLVCGAGVSGRQGGNPNSPSLDRIDSALGYVPGNVRVISHLANSMKGAATRDQLVSFAKWVLSDE